MNKLKRTHTGTLTRHIKVVNTCTKSSGNSKGSGCVTSFVQNFSKNGRAKAVPKGLQQRLNASLLCSRKNIYGDAPKNYEALKGQGNLLKEEFVILDATEICSENSDVDHINTVPFFKVRFHIKSGTSHSSEVQDTKTHRAKCPQTSPVTAKHSPRFSIDSGILIYPFKTLGCTTTIEPFASYTKNQLKRFINQTAKYQQKLATSKKTLGRARSNSILID